MYEDLSNCHGLWFKERKMMGRAERMKDGGRKKGTWWLTWSLGENLWRWNSTLSSPVHDDAAQLIPTLELYACPV